MEAVSVLGQSRGDIYSLKVARFLSFRQRNKHRLWGKLNLK
jgi:hypothetical protein